MNKTILMSLFALIVAGVLASGILVKPAQASIDTIQKLELTHRFQVPNEMVR